MTERRPGRPKGSKTKDPEQRRQELIDAAIAAVRKVGPEASMVEIAAEAGITKSVLYDHFDGKEGLQQAVTDRYGDALGALLGAGLDTDRTPAEVVRDAITAFVSFIERDRDVFRFISRGHNQMLDEAAPVFSALIGHTLRASGEDSGGAAIFAHATLGAVFAATEHWAEQPTMTRIDFVDYLTTMLWDGLSGAGLSSTESPVDMTPAIDAMRAAGKS